jgi:hypothetical protein
MGSTLFAFLKDEAPKMSRASLKKQVEEWFAKERSVVISDGEMPFNLTPSIHLLWQHGEKKWGVAIFYDEGKVVELDANEIKKRLGKKAPEGLEKLKRRVRVCFGDDRGNEFLDYSVSVLEFVDTIQDSIVYDLAQNKIVEPR